MEFIKLRKNRWLIKNSNSKIVDDEEKLLLEKEQLVIEDLLSNDCQGENTKKITDIDRELKNVKKTRNKNI